MQHVVVYTPFQYALFQSRMFFPLIVGIILAVATVIGIDKIMPRWAKHHQYYAGFILVIAVTVLFLTFFLMP